MQAIVCRCAPPRVHRAGTHLIEPNNVCSKPSKVRRMGAWAESAQVGVS